MTSIGPVSVLIYEDFFYLHTLIYLEYLSTQGQNNMNGLKLYPILLSLFRYNSFNKVVEMKPRYGPIYVYY